MFSGIDPDPITISLEYIDLCYAYPGTAKVATVVEHLKYIFGFYWGRKAYYKTFTAATRACKSIKEIEEVLRDDLREKFENHKKESEKENEDDLINTMEALDIMTENQIVRDSEDLYEKREKARPALGVI